MASDELKGSASPPAPVRGTMPRQIPFIIGNEACERFSFYGMRNVLTDFLVGYLLISLAEPTDARRPRRLPRLRDGVYFFPLLGGWLAIVSSGSTASSSGSRSLCVGQTLHFERRFQGGLLRRALPHRSGRRRHQALRVCLCGRINSIKQTNTWPRWSSTPSISSSTSVRSLRRS